MAWKIALAGNPNSGKTTLFNELTGSTAHVGNWPGVTIDRKEGKVKKGGQAMDVVDLPGIYSLSPYTPEEVIARNYIIGESPDLIINIVDATNIERNLYLTTQLLETDCPVVIALNMMDMMERQGGKVDAAGLQRALGVPVVAISALKGSGIDQLMAVAAKEAAKKRTGRSALEGSSVWPYAEELGRLLQGKSVAHPLFHAVKALEGDTLAKEALPADMREAAEVFAAKALAEIGCGDMEAATADIRYKRITSAYAGFVRRSGKPGELTASDKIDRVLTNKFLGIPIFLGLMFLVFHLTFSESLLGLEDVLSPGVWLQGLMEVLFGYLTDAASGMLEAAGASEWAMGLVVDGMIGGVGAVLSFVPQIMLLFLFLSILEDSGYMARAAFIMDRLLRRFGLSGKSFLPMLMGFGCSVPATMATRTLENEKDRRITMMLVPFMSCGAKMPIYAIFAAALFEQHSDVMTFAVYLTGILVAIIAGVILKHTVLKGEAAPFIMELPAYHLPRLKNLLSQLWDKLKGFVLRAGTIILGSTIVIWFLANFSFTLQIVDANNAESILGVIGNAIRPFFVPLGFASSDESWKAVVAILTGLIAKEAVVSTMGVLYAPGVEGDAIEDEAAGSALAATLAAAFSPAAALAFMAFNLLSIPCMAAVSAMWSEMRSAKWGVFTLAFWVFTAWVVSFAVFHIARLFGL